MNHLSDIRFEKYDVSAFKYRIARPLATSSSEVIFIFILPSYTGELWAYILRGKKYKFFENLEQGQMLVYDMSFFVKGSLKPIQKSNMSFPNPLGGHTASRVSYRFQVPHLTSGCVKKQVEL